MANGSDGRSTAGPEAVGRLDGRRLGRAAAKPATSAPSSGLAGGLPPRPPRTADIRHGRVRVLGDSNPPLFLWLRKTRIGSGDDLNVAWTAIGHRTADPRDRLGAPRHRSSGSSPGVVSILVLNQDRLCPDWRLG